MELVKRVELNDTYELRIKSLDGAIDLRLFAKSPKYFGYTKKGIIIPNSQIPSFIEKLVEVYVDEVYKTQPEQLTHLVLVLEDITQRLKLSGFRFELQRADVG